MQTYKDTPNGLYGLKLSGKIKDFDEVNESMAHALKHDVPNRVKINVPFTDLEPNQVLIGVYGGFGGGYLYDLGFIVKEQVLM